MSQHTSYSFRIHQKRRTGASASAAPLTREELSLDDRNQVDDLSSAYGWRGRHGSRRRYWLGSIGGEGGTGMITLSIMLANIMQGVDNTILNLALPHIEGRRSASLDQVAWGVDLLYRLRRDRRSVRH